ncbi:MAG: hypothetical protein HETSPECPRED_010611 [Heterodermia speciosa]|uniref:Uncharacterized protein n=1 Tax=Heterodermia speciosa TaxID=116794 RepID=A0A8H3G9V8_9LECA|nr:MAG: hypothetical protein HETSPECPRED_010611 [Heterodermia speciosa]
MECGFAGNADIYGIGIRIGYYTQALATWFANFFHYREAQVLRAVNNLFLVALLIAGSVYAARAQEVYAVESFLLLLIGMVISFVGVMRTTRYSTRYLRSCQDRLLSRTVITNAMLILNILFWWRGLDVMRPTPCFQSDSAQIFNATRIRIEERNTYIFYGSKVSLYGWFRTLYLVLSLAGWAHVTSTMVTDDAGKIIQRRRIRHDKQAFLEAATVYRKITEGHSPIVYHPREEASAKENSHVQPADLQNDNDSSIQSARDSQPHAPRKDTQSPLPEADDTNNIKREADSLRLASSNKLKIFVAVREAEEVLESIFSIYTKPYASPSNRRHFHFLGGRIKFSVQWIVRLEKQHRHPRLQCLWAYVNLFSASSAPMIYRWIISLHASGLVIHTPMLMPRIWYHTCRLHKTSGLPRWQMMAIASDVQLQQAPLKITTLSWTLLAAESLMLIIGLITQVEMTIAWNHISGLSSLTTLGQLIPFILGVGGLLKVLWGKWQLIRSGVKECQEDYNRPAGAYEIAMGNYIEWKNSQQASLVSAQGLEVPHSEATKEAEAVGADQRQPATAEPSAGPEMLHDQV